MSCAEIEILICEYVDGALGGAQRGAVEAHLAECPGCAALARDSAAALSFMERAADVEPPPELITQILFDAPWHKTKTGWFPKLYHSLLQPKFALSMAMTILWFSMLWGPVHQYSPADLRPAAVWSGIENRVYLVWARTVKFYENLKFVYQIQTTLREWQQDQDTQQPASDSDASTNKGDDHRLPLKGDSEQTPAPPPNAAGKP